MRNIVKIIIWVIIALVIIGCILFACIPMYLSSDAGKDSIIKRLEKKYGGDYSIEQLNFSWFGFQKAVGIKVEQAKEHLSAEEITLNISLLKLYGMRKYPLEMIFAGELLITGGKVYLPDKTSLTNINFTADNDSRTLTITGDTRTSSGRTGKFSIRGKQEPDWDWNGTTSYFPTQAIELFYPKFSAPAVLGESFNAQFTYINHNLDLVFDSPTLHFTTAGRLANHRFTLSKRTTINYVLDHLASDYLFQSSSIKPISAHAITAVVEPVNAHFTFDPFDPKSFYADKVTLDLGQMLFRNFGTLSDLLSVVELRFRPNQDVPIWFQEMPISVRKGVALIDITEMLVDNKYQLGLKSDVDFVEKEVDGMIVLRAQVLTRVFGLKSIPPTYSIILPFDGPFSDIHLHKSKALRQIARVVLAEKTGLPIIPYPTGRPAPPERPGAPWKHR